MKKLFLTFILLGLTTFGFSQFADLQIQNTTANPITVEIWSFTTPTCTPSCFITTVNIPAFTTHTQPAPLGPCDRWGRVYVLGGGSGVIGNPGTCAAIYSLSGISGIWTGDDCANCPQVVKFW